MVATYLKNSYLTKIKNLIVTVTKNRGPSRVIDKNLKSIHDNPIKTGHVQREFHGMPAGRHETLAVNGSSSFSNYFLLLFLEVQKEYNHISKAENLSHYLVLFFDSLLILLFSYYQLNNPNFKGVEFDTFRKQTILKNFNLTPQKYKTIF